MSSSKKKKIILIAVIAIELIIGFIFLFNFYQKKIVYKTQDPDKATIIKKENLIFPKESEYKHYWELKPNIIATDEPKWLGYQVKYNYNVDGLHDRFDYELEKSTDTFRIVTLGDSFTYGHFVNTNENWTEQLESMLNNSLLNISNIKHFEVINLGMPGFDIPYIVKRYKDIGMKYNPDLIIWFEGGSGFNRLSELMAPIIDDCQAQNSDTSSRGVVNCWLKAQQQIENEYKGEVDKIITNSLDDFYAFTSNNTVLVFTYEEDNLSSPEIDILNKWKSRYPMTIFASLVPNLSDKKQTLPDGHPNSDGHHTIALTIFDYLKNNLFNEYDQ